MDIGSPRDDLEDTGSVEEAGEGEEEYESETESPTTLSPRMRGKIMAPQIFHETSIHHHVKAIRKFENNGFRLLKKVVLQFMEEARKEMKQQTTYWQEIHDEQTEDIFELHEKIMELEE